MEKVEVLVEDITKSEQDEVMGTNLHDKFDFRPAMIRLSSIDLFMMDSEDTIAIFLNGAPTFIKYTSEIWQKLNEL